MTRILIYDRGLFGLPFALRCKAAGHQVRLWGPPSLIGDGMVDKVKDWGPSMRWADLVFVTDNAKGIRELESFHKKGFPIFGPNMAASELELDREVGQRAFEEAGIDILPFRQFHSYNDGIRYVEKEKKPFVSKPWGGLDNKDLSYVPETAEDLIERLRRWKKKGVKADFLLQEKIDGHEMAIGGWFGPGGFSKWLNENWEEKRLMAGGLGPNTGEMGTVMRYVRRSRLFDAVLKPVEDYLASINYVGYVDVNCLVDDEGVPWPLEFTCRPGWPHFDLCCALHKGDPAQWMLDLLAGKDTLSCSEEVCVGVVMAMKDYPWDLLPKEDAIGWPIRGLTKAVLPHVALSSVMMGPACVKPGEPDEEVIVTAASYVLVVTGLGGTVQEAQKAVYGVCDKICWPPHRTYRNDIGCRLEKDLPALQEHGFAKGMEF